MATSFIGCATPRHVDELRSDIKEVQQQNLQADSTLTHLDSLVNEESDGNRRLRADVSATVEQLSEHISRLQASYQDLLQKIDAIYHSLQEKHVLKGSPGSQQEIYSQTPEEPPETSGESSVDCSISYDNAFIMVRKGEYENAVEAFQAFIQDCENHELVENAHYWIGESYYSLERFVDAIDEFEFLLKTYKSSVNTSRALYKLGRCKQELGKGTEAKAVFEKLIEEHSGTLESEQARERLKELK